MSGDFLYGYVDQYGKWLLQPQYTTTTPFVQNWAIVSIISGNEEEKQQVWQIIDKDKVRQHNWQRDRDEKFANLVRQVALPKKSRHEKYWYKQ